MDGAITPLRNNITGVVLTMAMAEPAHTGGQWQLIRTTAALLTNPGHAIADIGNWLDTSHTPAPSFVIAFSRCRSTLEDKFDGEDTRFRDRFGSISANAAHRLIAITDIPNDPVLVSFERAAGMII
jgi:hypothetical protein